VTSSSSSSSNRCRNTLTLLLEQVDHRTDIIYSCRSLSPASHPTKNKSKQKTNFLLSAVLDLINYHHHKKTWNKIRSHKKKKKNKLKKNQVTRYTSQQIILQSQGRPSHTSNHSQLQQQEEDPLFPLQVHLKLVHHFRNSQLLSLDSECWSSEVESRRYY